MVCGTQNQFGHFWKDKNRQMKVTGHLYTTREKTLAAIKHKDLWHPESVWPFLERQKSSASSRN